MLYVQEVLGSVDEIVEKIGEKRQIGGHEERVVSA